MRSSSRSILPLCSRCPAQASRGVARVSSISSVPNPQSRPRHVIHLDRRWNSTVSSSSPAHAPFQAGPTALEPHHGARPQRTHQCSSLSTALEGQNVVLGGWLFAQRRASPSLHFFTLRDSTGSVQLICRSPEVSDRLMALPLESVVQVQGAVRERKQKSKAGSNAPSDEIEVDLTSAILLNPAEANLPFYPNRPELANEEVRAQYRYLDLRRTELADNLRLRSKVAHLIRNYLHETGFTEVETPILLNSSPEGAREFLVPTRASSTQAEPHFFALQQSPQQPKQLLIASGGIDRYYQLARCFRDEDGRKDRQPEFTQVDLEMAFVSGAGLGERDTWGVGGREIKEVVEDLVRKVWKGVKGVELGDFRVMPYQVAMDVYGSDKPDTRFENYTLPIGYYPGLSDNDLDKILLDESLYTVEWMITRAADVQELDIPALTLGNSFVDHVKITKDNMNSWSAESPLLKPLHLELSEDGAVTGGGVEPGDIIWLAQRKKIAEGGWTQLGRLRIAIMEALVAKGAMTLPDTPHFLWITQFPLFTRADEDKEFLSHGRWASSHHPFTAPMEEDLAELKKGNVEGVRGQHYDLVLNGQEIGGGSVRVHDSKLQEYIMRDVLKLDEDEMSRFSHLLQALKFGAPPHGGIALGFDRLIAILVGAKSIREVIAFPKTTGGTDPVFKSPSGASAEVLKDYGLRSLEAKKEAKEEKQE